MGYFRNALRRKENEIMNQLQIFNNAEFRVDTIGYQNGSRDINRHVDEEDCQKYAVWKDLDK